MELSGESRIPAPCGRVWQALNDVNVLRACIPGCEEIAQTADNELRARIATKIGPMKATFSGRVTLSDLDPPHGYTISGQGDGGAAGFVRGSARVVLDAAGESATLLRWAATVDVGGKLAALGNRLVQGAAISNAEHFFSRLSAAAANGEVMAAPQPKSAPQPSPATPPERHGPATATTPVTETMPPQTTVPYMLGQTPRQQNTIIAVSGLLWLAIVALIVFR